MDENERFKYENLLLSEKKIRDLMEIKHAKQVAFYQILISFLLSTCAASIITIILL